MFDFILADGNLPFAVALGLMLGIAVLEGTMTMLGAGISQAIDALLPESLGEVDIDVDGDFDVSPDIADINGTGADFGDADIGNASVGATSALSKVLGWLCVGRVPVLILLVAFLTVFGLTGLIVQSLIQGVTGAMLPSSLAAIPAIIVAVPSIRIIGTGLAKLIPKDESSAVTVNSFIGRIATITIGTARAGQPAEAKLRDAHGQTHYVMVEPDNPDDEFEVATQVLLVARSGSRFQAILNTSSALVDD